MDKVKTDLAEAIFGWSKGIEHENSCAGRVFFSDAYLQGAITDRIWYSPQKMITPHILATPKPSTFQHYLVQDKNRNHNPDKKECLAHYGTSKSETQIRGFKQYWHKGSNLKLRQVKRNLNTPSQLTRICPINSGVSFSFTIYFENLEKHELGALLWALMPRGNQGEFFCQKLGMGKPLGIGCNSHKKCKCLFN